MNPASDTTAATHDRIQHLVTQLLHQAVVVSHAVTRLHTLAQTYPNGEPTAHAQVNEAITAMSGVRMALIHNADHLTGLLHLEQTGTPTTDI